MKKIILFTLIIAIFSCTKKANDANYKTTIKQIGNQSEVNMNKDEFIVESIDTAEFIVYWNKFRKAILERDTTTLSSMINDNIKGDFISNKNLFLNNLDAIFTPEFLLLLKFYKIEKYLGNDQEIILWKLQNPETYACITFDSIQMNPKENASYQVVYFTMYYERDKECYQENYIMLTSSPVDDYFAFELMFVKSLSGIKLYQIDKITRIDICDSP